MDVEGEESDMDGLGAFGDARTIVPDFQVASTHGVMGHRSPAKGHTGSLTSTILDHHISLLVTSRGNLSFTDPN